MKVLKLALLILLIGGIVAAGVLVLRTSNRPQYTGDSQYQAVFLTNGQVYFGQLTEQATTLLLTDVYYLRVQSQLQPPEEGEPRQELSLVKLGNELHGPEDEMRINTEQVLFVEDLRSDGQVAQAIEEYLQSSTE